MINARLHWRRLFKQCTRRVRSLADKRTGKSRAARIPITATTTSSSIKVKPALESSGPRLLASARRIAVKKQRFWLRISCLTVVSYVPAEFLVNIEVVLEKRFHRGNGSRRGRV